MRVIRSGEDAEAVGHSIAKEKQLLQQSLSLRNSPASKQPLELVIHLVIEARVLGQTCDRSVARATVAVVEGDRGARVGMAHRLRRNRKSTCLALGEAKERGEVL